MIDGSAQLSTSPSPGIVTHSGLEYEWGPLRKGSALSVGAVAGGAIWAVAGAVGTPSRASASKKVQNVHHQRYVVDRRFISMLLFFEWCGRLCCRDRSIAGPPRRARATRCKGSE